MTVELLELCILWMQIIGTTLQTDNHASTHHSIFSIFFPDTQPTKI